MATSFAIFPEKNSKVHQFDAALMTVKKLYKNGQKTSQVVSRLSKDVQEPVVTSLPNMNSMEKRINRLRKTQIDFSHLTNLLSNLFIRQESS
jgi:S-adenosylhomocysteine hydrolase